MLIDVSWSYLTRYRWGALVEVEKGGLDHFKSGWMLSSTRVLPKAAFGSARDVLTHQVRMCSCFATGDAQRRPHE